MHTLGELFVPFHMEQVYARRAAAHGNDDLFVVRAIRDTGHCGFTLSEQIQAFADMVTWVRTGVRPAGDDVLDRRLTSPTPTSAARSRWSTGPVWHRARDDVRHSASTSATRPPITGRHHRMTHRCTHGAVGRRRGAGASLACSPS